MKKMLLIFLALTLIFSLTACKENGSDASGIDWENSVIIVDPNDPFRGVWVDEVEGVMATFYTLHGDGTGYADITDIRFYVEYEYTDTEFTLINYPDTLEESHSYTYTYTFNEDGTLTLYNEEHGELNWYLHEGPLPWE